MKRTTFILGAGASHHLGFPLGQELKEMVVNGRVATAGSWYDSSQWLTYVGFSADDVNLLRSALFDCVRTSVDGFLQIPANRGYDGIARAAMAAVLIPLEKQCAQRRWKGGQACWYRHLFNAVLPDDIATGHCKSLPLRVITLNFDRSFEQALAFTLYGTFGVPADEAPSVAAEQVPVTHLHGSLFGSSSWISPQDETAATVEEIKRSAECLRVVGDQLDSAAVDAAVDSIYWAQRICLLGFGFHPFVEGRLGLPPSLRDKEVHATCHGIDPGRLGHLKSRYSSYRCEFHQMDIETFLRSTHVLFD